MKYAVINERGGINRVSPKAITGNPEGTTVVELTDEQAAQVEAGRTATPRVLYFWQGNTLIAMAQKQAEQQAARLAERAATMTPEEKIHEGEKAVERSGLTAARLVTLMDLLLTTKEANAMAAHPKLVSLYTWLQTVKGMSIAGIVAFPPAPHTFEEVLSE